MRYLLGTNLFDYILSKHRHSMEHILYNMLVKVYQVVDSANGSQVKPELALLNSDGDRINKDIDSVRERPFVGDEFQPVRGNWFNVFKDSIVCQMTVDRRYEHTALVEMLPLEALNVSEAAVTYRRMYLNNINRFLETYNTSGTSFEEVKYRLK